MAHRPIVRGNIRGYPRCVVDVSSMVGWKEVESSWTEIPSRGVGDRGDGVDCRRIWKGANRESLTFVSKWRQNKKPVHGKVNPQGPNGKRRNKLHGMNKQITGVVANLRTLVASPGLAAAGMSPSRKNIDDILQLEPEFSLWATARPISLGGFQSSITAHGGEQNL